VRRVIPALALVVGVVAGYTATVALSGDGSVDPSATPSPVVRLRSDATSTTAARPTSTDATPAIPPAPPVAQTFLVWSTGGLPPELTDGLTDRFDDLSIVLGDVVELDDEGGAVVPLDALGVDPVAHRPFDPGTTMAPLRPGTAVLSETSARVRGVSIGDSLVVSGHEFEVVAVAPDHHVAAAEVVFHRDDGQVSTPRFALIASDLARDGFEAVVRELYDGPAPLRIRTQAETPWLRHGDAVLPQVYLKEALGEFTYTERSGSEFVQDPAFHDQHIVTGNVPLVGVVECHRTVMGMLEGALGQLAEEGSGHVVDPDGYAGCWYPRFTRTVTGAPSGLSRHSWGAAVDINAPANPMGSEGTQDPRLIEVMQEWGFTWGGDWLIPDPMHFEYGLPPDTDP
jgi:hypothetical protein